MPNNLVIVTAAAEYRLSRRQLQVFARLDFPSNTPLEHPVHVADVVWGRTVHPFRISDRGADGRTTVLGRGVTLEFDPRLCRISVPSWDMPLPYEVKIRFTPTFHSSRSINMNQWMDRSVGFMTMNQFTDTPAVCRPGETVGFAALPSRLRDERRLYEEGSRPLVFTVFEGHDELLQSDPDRLQQWIDKGFGVAVLWNHYFEGGAKPTLREGVVGYNFKSPEMEDKWTNTIAKLKAFGFSVLTYVELHNFHERHQKLGVTLQWMRDFRRTHNLDGFYLDGGRVADQWYRTYDFWQDFTPGAVTYFHNTMDAWTGSPWPGYSCCPQIALADYVLHGEQVVLDSFEDGYWKYTSDTRGGAIPDHKPWAATTREQRLEISRELGRIGGALRIGYGDSADFVNAYLEEFTARQKAWSENS